MHLHLKKILIICLLAISFKLLFREKKFSKILNSGMCSTKKINVLVYHGPSSNSPIAFKIVRNHYPLIIQESKKNWVKIADYEGSIGWVNKNQLSSDQYVILLNEIVSSEHKIILKPRVIVKFIEEKSNKFCVIEIYGQQILTKCENIWYENKAQEEYN